MRPPYGRFYGKSLFETGYLFGGKVKLIKKTPCKWIILSYSSGGRATARELNEVMNDNGELVDTIEVDYKKNVMATMKWTNEWVREAEEPNREFLFLLKKDKSAGYL